MSETKKVKNTANTGGSKKKTPHRAGPPCVNGKKKIYSIFLDIDGTLLNEEGGPFADDLAAMKEAARRGHLIFLNTGRSFANIPLSLFGLPFIHGIAAGCGSHILVASGRREKPYESIYRTWISDEILTLLFAHCLRHKRGCYLEGENECYIINQAFMDTARPSLPVKSLEDFIRKRGCDLITKFTLEGFASGQERRFLEPYFTLNCFAEYSEGILAGESKGNAMRLILERFSLSNETSIAVGDSANDLDMICEAARGVAMGNASPEIKAAADAVTLPCGSGGVAKVIRDFVLRKT